MTEEEKSQKKADSEVKTFKVPFSLRENQGHLTINTNTLSKPSKEEIINQAFKFHSQGNISEAAKYYQDFINQGFKDHIVFTNYGVILKNLGKLQEAEFLYRKAIELKPDLAEAHYNLGSILIDLGENKNAILCFEKTLEIRPWSIKALYGITHTCEINSSS